MTFTRDDVRNFEPYHDSFVGLDSDGCVLDTMEIKQRQCFQGEIVRLWGLEAIESMVLEVAEFVGLYSRWRGANRFAALLKTFDLLAEWEAVRGSGAPLPDMHGLRAYIESGVTLSNATLQAACERTGDKELRTVLAWSEAVNENVARIANEVKPFPWARETLTRMRARSDLMVVSQTATEALVREWRMHGLDGFVQGIGGLEWGAKAEQLRLATQGRYPPDRVLMVGDAPGDLLAARAVGARFYPICPGREERSWRRLHDEAYDRFLEGSFDEAYQAARVEEFDALLPDTPPWLRQNGADTVEPTGAG